jgi:voltage-gated potassium channel
MISLALAVWNFVVSLSSGVADPAFRRLFVLAFVLLLTGTIAMNRIEGLAPVDAFYFSVITLTTVGFGDFTPETTMGKLFTAFYVLSGIGVIVAFIDALGQYRLARSRRRHAAG